MNGAINQPKSLQTPHPPLWIAGGGEKKTLRVVAKYAATPTRWHPEAFTAKSRILDEALRGYRPGSLPRSDGRSTCS